MSKSVRVLKTGLLLLIGDTKITEVWTVPLTFVVILFLIFFPLCSELIRSLSPSLF